MKKLDILAVGVHPDDVELGCGGTLLKHIAAGYSVGICDLTMGQLGTKGSPELRLQEAEASRALMGALVRENLGMEDGFFTHDEQHLRQIITVIRRYKPDVVLANAIEDRHPDHGRAAKLIADACFYSGLIKIDTKVDGVSQEHWRPRAVYHYIQDRELAASFVVDVSPYMEQKIACVMAFSSQFYDPSDTGPQTPISGKDFMEALRAKQRIYGRHLGVEYGEGFTSSRYIGIPDIMKLQ